MKFRTKICMLPLSAAAVFLVGMAISVVLGSNLSRDIKQLRDVEEPYLTQLSYITRNAEQIEQVFQNTIAEGDADKLKEAQPFAASAEQSLLALQRLQDKQAIGTALSSAFNAYQEASRAAVLVLIGKGEGDPNQLNASMQARHSALKKMLSDETDLARVAIDARYEKTAKGISNSLLATLSTGGLVLVVLGVASWIILNFVWKQLGDEPDALCAQVRRIANGELDLALQAEPGDNHSLKAALITMTADLRQMIGDIRQSADQICSASIEIADGNQNLSNRTEQTASNLQQTASSMERLTITVQDTAKSARLVNDLASSASTAAQHGGTVVEEVVVNMHQINAAAGKITEIIAVIDGIAFQTNILALNAAVEAARAGEQGRGFAVVASEVRSLAQRSSQAAKEIKMLIDKSTQTVDSGARLVGEAGASMQEIVARVRRVNDTIRDISSAMDEQTGGLGAVSETVTQLDDMTQKNAALVEQSASAAEGLRMQAVSLGQTVARFKI
jgi:methyl-accepting chemotaxis protein